MFDKQELLKSFQDMESKIAFSHVLDGALRCIRKQELVYTDFIDPAQIARYENILKKINGVYFTTFGGNALSERRMIGFYPIKQEPLSLCGLEAAFPISCLKISGHSKMDKLSHRDYLGAVLGLSIERKKVGDIIVKDGAYIFVHKDISPFILYHLDKVSRASVTVTAVPLMEASVDNRFLEIKKTVSAPRLDAVIGAAFHLSRSKAQGLIKSEKAFVNGSMMLNTSYTVKENDAISLRGFGKIIFKQILGTTKKNRISVCIYKYI